MIDKSYIKSVADQYGLDGIAAELESRLSEPMAKIGFVGPFSSGKTSLINALLGTHLPVDIKPTTKAICIIEAASGIDGPMYYRDACGTREEIDFMTFCDIINGDSSGDAVMCVPEGGILREGTVFVDTPGVDSMGAEEAEMTYSYLSMMDAAVVCIPVEDGTVKKSVMDFVCSANLRPIAKNLVFVLTKSDTKKPEAVKSIQDEVVRKLSDASSEGRLPIQNIADRVFAMSRENAADQLPSILERHHLSHVKDMIANREQKELRSIAGGIAAILRKRAESLTFDASQYEAEIDNIRHKQEAIRQDMEQKRAEMANMEEKLHERLLGVMLSHRMAVLNAKDEVSRRDGIDAMMRDVNSTVEEFCKRHVASFSPASDLVGGIDEAFDASFRNIERIRNLSVTATTAVATAFICPGASAGANAGEAVAGAAGQQAAKIAAANAAKCAAAARTAATASTGKTSLLTRILGGIGKVIKEINPLETVGDIVSEKIKSSSFEDIAKTSSWRIADRVVANLAEPYEREVISPLLIRLNDQERSIEAQMKGRHKAAEDVREDYRRMTETAKALEAFAATESQS